MKQAFLVSKALGLTLLRTIADKLGDALVLHPEDSADARGVMPDIAELCRERGLRFQVVATRAEAEAALQDFRPDIAFVCGWYWLLCDHTRALARRGFFGIHNSLLPKYRGGAPLVWAIINGEPEVGSSLYRLKAGADDGPLAHQVRFELPRTATIADAGERIEAEWEAAFPQVWTELCKDKLRLSEQDGEATRFRNRRPEDGEIDWSLPAAKVHDFIRAQAPPYPGAFWTVDDQRIHIDHSCEARGFGLEMQCGDGRSLRVTLRHGHPAFRAALLAPPERAAAD